MKSLFAQQLWLGKVLVLGSAVVIHTSFTGTFPLGDVESTIRVPIELSLPRDACLQNIRQVVTDKHETSGKYNWLYRSNEFQVSKHGFWNHCSKVNDVACGGCHADSRVAGDAEWRS